MSLDERFEDLNSCKGIIVSPPCSKSAAVPAVSPSPFAAAAAAATAERRRMQQRRMQGICLAAAPAAAANFNNKEIKHLKTTPDFAPSETFLCSLRHPSILVFLGSAVAAAVIVFPAVAVIIIIAACYCYCVLISTETATAVAVYAAAERC